MPDERPLGLRATRRVGALTLAAVLCSAPMATGSERTERLEPTDLPAYPTAVGGMADGGAGEVRGAGFAETPRTTARRDPDRAAREVSGPFPTLSSLSTSVSLEEKRDQARTQRSRRKRAIDRAARRLEADRRVALAAMWQPDPSLLAVRGTDSPQTAAVRARLTALVSRLRTASADYETALYAADRSRVDARKARVVAAAATARADIARQRWAEDRAALGAIAADTYRNGSVGQLGLMLGAGGAEDDEAFFSGLTLLTQVSSAQGDATARAAESAAALREAEQEQERTAARAARLAERRAAALVASDQARRTVVADVRKAQDIIRDSILIDEIAAAVDTDELTETSARAAAELEGGVVFPLPADSGWRDNDNWGRSSGRWKRSHTGDDFSVACGTPVYAAHEGVVTIRTDQGWSGKWLVMVQAAEGGLATWYAHMSGLSTQHGKQVEAGEQIGYVGSLGNSTGCHLHFEVHPLGGSIYEDNVDPVAWLTIARGYPNAQ